MKIEGIFDEGVFLERPNRFIGVVLIKGERHISHVPNTGKLKEILVPGVRVLLRRADGKNRKTRYSLVFVMKDNIWISIDSANIPNKIVYEDILENLFSEFLKGGTVKREHKVGNSRFDFALFNGDRSILIEVKGVTLVEDGRGYFPDSPTTRGTRHVYELAREKNEKTRTAVIFLAQREDARMVIPNYRTDKPFCEGIKYAASMGVELYAFYAKVDFPNREMKVMGEIPVILAEV